MTDKVFCTGKDEAFEEKVRLLFDGLEELMAQSAWLKPTIREQLQGYGFGG